MAGPPVQQSSRSPRQPASARSEFASAAQEPASARRAEPSAPRTMKHREEQQSRCRMRTRERRHVQTTRSNYASARTPRQGGRLDLNKGKEKRKDLTFQACFFVMLVTTPTM